MKTKNLNNVDALRAAFNFERDQYTRAFNVAMDAMRNSVYTDVAVDAMRLASEAAERAEVAWKEYQEAEARRGR